MSAPQQGQTPRTDAAEIAYDSRDGSAVSADFARQLERELSEARTERDSETKWAKHYLAGLEQAEARRATLAAENKRLKSELKDLKASITCEGMDPNGTIWDHADKVQKENAQFKAQLAAHKEWSEKAREAIEELCQDHRTPWRSKYDAILATHPELQEGSK